MYKNNQRYLFSETYFFGLFHWQCSILCISESDVCQEPINRAANVRCDSILHSASLSEITSYCVWNIAVIDNTQLAMCFENRKENRVIRSHMVTQDISRTLGSLVLNEQLGHKRKLTSGVYWEGQHNPTDCRVFVSLMVFREVKCFTETQSAQSESLLFSLISRSTAISLLQSGLNGSFIMGFGQLNTVTLLA